MDLARLLSSILFGILLFVGLANSLVPLVPRVPHAGLDPSWQFAMNTAVERGMAVGQDIVFTFGPLAAVYTKLYLPGSQSLVLGVALLITVAITLAITHIARGSVALSALAIALLFSSVISNDALFLSLPFFFALYALRATEEGRGAVPDVLLLIFIAVPVGILPTIKGTMVLGSTAFLALGAAALLLNQRPGVAFSVIVAAIIAFISAWSFAGQEIGGIPSYFEAILPIIDGYSEAMASWGPATHLLVYILTGSCAIIAMTVRPGWRERPLHRFLEVAAIGLFLFLCWKQGFVRHDGHRVAAACALILVAIPVAAALRSHGLPWKMVSNAVILSLLVAAIMVQGVFFQVRPEVLAKRFARNFDILAHLGAPLSTSDLDARHEEALARIRDEAPMPLLPGTADIYPYDQSALIASGNLWAPRPVFQSYLAYTPELAMMNRRHLEGPDAPDNLFIAIHPIDGRMPTLADGASWPVFMQRYRVAELVDKYLRLEQREADVEVQSTDRPPFEAQLGVPFEVPEGIVFAKVELRPTLFGRLLNVIFRPPEIRLILELANGSTRDFRVISTMMETGFLLSPLVETTPSLALAMSGRERALEGFRVVSAMLRSKPSWLPAWRSRLDIRYSFLEPEVERLPQEAVSSEIFGADVRSALGDCSGEIDTINGVRWPGSVPRSDLLIVSGWLADAGKETPPPGQLLVGVSLADGSEHVFAADSVSRDDVRAHFENPTLPDVGFKATIDLAERPAVLSMRIIGETGGEFLACPNLTVDFTQDDDI
jgi:hypothetical protein